MKFQIGIKETSSYLQVGSVEVEAETLEEAERKIHNRDYYHNGDNDIQYSSEIVISRGVESKEEKILDSGIEYAKEILKKAGYMIGNPFHVSDLHKVAENFYGTTLSDDEAEDVAYRVNKNFDPDTGLNWDVIDYWVDETIRNRK